VTFVSNYQGGAGTAASTCLGAACVGHRSLVYRACKLVLEFIFTTLVLLPAMLIVATTLVVLNPYLNPGPVFFGQPRMGRHCRPFRAFKFRTMTEHRNSQRGPDDPIETDRITPLGQWLRKSRFDELPQILNVYRGDMSLIGPRPDEFRHAQHYLHSIPAYRDRHSVRPGISGLAQIELGYAEGMDATRRKTRADMDYIARATIWLDLWIFWRTIVTVVRMRGA
jgi:lipopolysaccharide/colanic/teichoic acid biosynthesis glycosyltransferase